ncbi:hypothetical protein [Psychromonas aquimarina]|uniref:hypothetical protein n=1 Tax=Psychromonas aquimarina TaxID=444919 RepID=UPI00041172BC|nr:hypothetical protein [Psychromonas aquimarina]
MADYKYIVDALSSTAALTAIVTVLWSWFKNSQMPLKIERLVVHNKASESTYIIVIKNSKTYPVNIKSTSCYTKVSYKVEKKNNQKPEYMDTLSLSDNLFLNNDDFEIGANGHTDIRIIGSHLNPDITKLLFTIQTSHGYHQIWCDSIITVDMIGKTASFGMEKMYNFDSKFKAKRKYYWLKFITLFRRLVRR